MPKTATWQNLFLVVKRGRQIQHSDMPPEVRNKI